MTTMEKLPEDVLVNIMTRLFSKQLAQMRSISKYWKALLSKPSFIKSHLHRSIRTNEQVLLLFDRSRNFQPLATIPLHTTTDFIKAPVTPRTESGKGNMVVIGAVHGLICSSYDDHSVIHIWNPSLSAVLTLPPYSTPSFSNGYRETKTHLRFGFDPETDDYKVVKLTGLKKSNTFLVGWWLPVEIYSMRKGSWEVITEWLPSHIISLYEGDDVCVDGHNGLLHWLGRKTDSKTIVAFDLSTQTFCEMPFPNDSAVDSFTTILGILSGKLCVLSMDVPTDAIQVWVMEEDDSWAKRHVLPHFPQLASDINAYGFTSRGDFIVSGYCCVVLYDPIEKKHKWVEDFSPELCFTADHIVEYVDSLVWVSPPSDGLVVDGGQISL